MPRGLTQNARKSGDMSFFLFDVAPTRVLDSTPPERAINYNPSNIFETEGALS